MLKKEPSSPVKASHFPATSIEESKLDISKVRECGEWRSKMLKGEENGGFDFKSKPERD